MRKREQESRADAARKATYAAALEREAVRVASIQASLPGYLQGLGYSLKRPIWRRCVRCEGMRMAIIQARRCSILLGLP